jgi:hypothetical protein
MAFKKLPLVETVECIQKIYSVNFIADPELGEQNQRGSGTKTTECVKNHSSKLNRRSITRRAKSTRIQIQTTVVPLRSI